MPNWPNQPGRQPAALPLPACRWSKGGIRQERSRFRFVQFTPDPCEKPLPVTSAAPFNPANFIEFVRSSTKAVGAHHHPSSAAALARAASALPQLLFQRTSNNHHESLSPSLVLPTNARRASRNPCRRHGGDRARTRAGRPASHSIRLAELPGCRGPSVGLGQVGLGQMAQPNARLPAIQRPRLGN